jgi:phage gp36-like protein
MAYANSQNVYDIIAQAMTSATSPVVNGQPVPLWTFGKAKSNNNIPDTVVEQYLSWATEQIDATLSEMYVTPLEEKADLEMTLLSDIDVYNGYAEVDRASALNIGDNIVLIDSLTEERHVVASVMNGTTVVTQNPILGIYFAETSRIMRVKYPSTITLICSRLAAAHLYDKYFSSQVSPNKSDYGSTLRKWALSDLNAILNGIIILHGQKRIGHRFYNPTLRDRYGLPGLEGGAGDREMKGGDA